MVTVRLCSPSLTEISEYKELAKEKRLDMQLLIWWGLPLWEFWRSSHYFRKGPDLSLRSFKHERSVLYTESYRVMLWDIRAYRRPPREYCHRSVCQAANAGTLHERGFKRLSDLIGIPAGPLRPVVIVRLSVRMAYRINRSCCISDRNGMMDLFGLRCCKRANCLTPDRAKPCKVGCRGCHNPNCPMCTPCAGVTVCLGDLSAVQNYFVDGCRDGVHHMTRSAPFESMIALNIYMPQRWAKFRCWNCRIHRLLVVPIVVNSMHCGQLDVCA